MATPIHLIPTIAFGREDLVDTGGFKVVKGLFGQIAAFLGRPGSFLEYGNQIACRLGELLPGRDVAWAGLCGFGHIATHHFRASSRPA